MTLAEKKLHCSIVARQFELTGTIHLFEHDYDGFWTFWHGVTEVALDKMTFDALGMFGLDSQNVLFTVTLEDGREGYARIPKMKRSWSGEEEIVLLAVCGVSSFSTPPPHLPVGP